MACETIENTPLQSETIRDKLKEAILSLTDEQAEYVWEKISEWLNY